MLTIPANARTANFPKQYSYCHGWNRITRMVLPITRGLRAKYARKHMAMEPFESHMDIGCGDGYFLSKSPAKVRVGFDNLLGDEIEDLANHDPEQFDLVTMLAVVEHLERPREQLCDHVWRVIKPGGRLILTTPKYEAEKFIKLYVPNIDDEHEIYFDRETMTDILYEGFELVKYETFIFGLNQVFTYRRLPEKRSRKS